MARRYFVKRTSGRVSKVPSYMAAVSGRRSAANARWRSQRQNQANRGLQLSKGEFKSVDTQLESAVCSNDGITPILLNGIARGDEINQRNGREVTIKSIELRYMIESEAASGPVTSCRVMLVYDKQTNGAALTSQLVLNGTGDARTPFQPRNLENRKRFWILYDEMFDIGALGQAAAVGSIPRQPRKFYRRITLPTVFNSGDAGTVADITTGSLYLLAFTDVSAGGTEALLEGMCRVRYQDK